MNIVHKKRNLPPPYVTRYGVFFELNIPLSFFDKLVSDGKVQPFQDEFGRTKFCSSEILNHYNSKKEVVNG